MPTDMVGRGGVIYLPPVVTAIAQTFLISNDELVCETPEMTSMKASIVSHVMDQRSRAWVPGSIVEVESLPRYKYDCPVELSGRCFDCCEAECQFQVLFA